MKGCDELLIPVPVNCPVLLSDLALLHHLAEISRRLFYHTDPCLVHDKGKISYIRSYIDRVLNELIFKFFKKRYTFFVKIAGKMP